MANDAENADDIPSLRDDSELKGLVVTVLGRSGAGKTALLNNILQTDDIISLSPDRGTTNIELRKSTSGNIAGIDVPGFEHSKREEWKKMLSEISAKLGVGEGKVHLILLCLPVGPSNKFDADGTPEIMEHMHKVMGKNIWGNCIIVFTFSNIECPKREDIEHIRYLEQYTERFREELQGKLNAKDVEVKSIFQYSPDQDTTTIVTIPAGKSENDSVNPESQQAWIDDVFNLIKIKCPEVKSRLAEYQNWRRKLAGMLSGAAAGAAGMGIAYAMHAKNAGGGTPGMIFGGILEEL